MPQLFPIPTAKLLEDLGLELAVGLGWNHVRVAAHREEATEKAGLSPQRLFDLGVYSPRSDFMRRRPRVAFALLILASACGHRQSRSVTIPADAPPRSLAHQSGSGQVVSLYEGWDAVGFHEIRAEGGWRSRYLHVDAAVDDIASLGEGRWALAHGTTGQVVWVNEDDTDDLGVVGTVEPAPLQLASGDLDNDGHADLVVASHGARPLLQLMYRRGDGFTPPLLVPIYPRGRTRPTVMLTDLDGEGTLDVLASVTSGGPNASVPDHLRVFRNTTHGRLADEWMAAVPSPAHLHAGDFDEDGLLDVLATGPDGAWLLRSAGYGWLDSADQITRLPTTDGQLVDVNRDGHLDVVLLHTKRDTLEVREGSGAGRFGLRRRYPVDPGPVALAVVEHPDTTVLISANTEGRSFSSVTVPVGRSASRRSGT